MSAGVPAEWQELAELWKARSPSISIGELQRHARRDRLRSRLIAGAALLSGVLGIASALWLAWASPLLYAGWGMAVFIAIFTAIAWRVRVLGRPSVGEDAIRMLTAAQEREQRTLAILAVARIVILAALCAVVVATSVLLMHFEGHTFSGLLPSIASSAYLIAAAIAVTVLSRRSHRRVATFAQLAEHLTNSHEPKVAISTQREL